MNTQIIYFHFKGFFVPFMTLHGIGFKFFAKIIKGSSVFCCSNCINVNPTSHRKGILQWKTFNILYTTLYTILSQTPGVKLKRIFECILRIPSSARRCNINSKAWKLWNFFHARVDQSPLNVCTKFLGKITGRRRPHICKWAFFWSSAINIMVPKYFATNYANN